jgi:stage V sporulation protein SpoVS
MNISKRKRLKAKRTPWVKTRSGRKANAIANCMRAAAIAQGMANFQAIRSAAFSSQAEKTMAVARATVNAFSAVASVPVYGSKTV